MKLLIMYWKGIARRDRRQHQRRGPVGAPCQSSATAALAWLCTSTALLLSAPGCIRFTTAQVQIRDPTEVVLYANRHGASAVVLPAGPTPATAEVATAVAWAWFTPTPLHIRASRSADGALRLLCPECSQPSLRGLTEVLLIDGDGRLAPTVAAQRIAPATLTLPYQLCFLRSRRSCRVSATVELAIPRSNVVTAALRHAPSRWLGALLVADGALVLAGGVLFLSATVSDDPRLRYGAGGSLAGIGTAAVAAGLWSLLAAATEEPMPGW